MVSDVSSSEVDLRCAGHDSSGKRDEHARNVALTTFGF